MSEYTFPVGKIVGFHGLKGEVKIRPQTNNPLLLLDIDDVEIIAGKERHRVEVKDVKLEKRMLFIKFEHYPDRTSVEHLLDAQVFTTRDQLNELEEDEFWITDLIGLSVYTTEGREVGTISGITGNSAELLEVSSVDKKETYLVPFVKALVPTVDMKARRVEVVDLPGLLEPS
jgi:16S rRNA processing protein RimM